MIAEECIRVDIEFMASVFDIKRISWAENIEMKRYKIASRSINDMELIKEIGKTGKPVLASLGMWEGEEFPVFESVKDMKFLYCVSKYPTLPEDLDLEHIDFSKYIGFSDHTVGIDAAMQAFSIGAKIVEKHFTLDTNMYGPDHSGSMTPDQLKELSDFRKARQ